MEIHGLQKLTLLDFPGHTACTVFTGRCNFRCPFCQNASLVLRPESLARIPEEDVFAFLDYALNTLYAKSRLNATLEAKRKEVMQNHGDEAFQAGEKAAETRTG